MFGDNVKALKGDHLVGDESSDSSNLTIWQLNTICHVVCMDF